LQEAGRVFTEKIALIFKRPASALQSLDKTEPFQDEDMDYAEGASDLLQSKSFREKQLSDFI